MKLEEAEKELSSLKQSLKALEDKFSMFTTIVLFALALQVAGAIYTGISVKDSANDFIRIKTQEFNQIIANEKLDPNVKIEAEDLLASDFRIAKGQSYLSFSVGINNIGITQASNLTIRVLLPESIKTKYQSFEDKNYPYEGVVRPAKGDLYVPPNATFRQGVNIPIDKEAIESLESGDTVKMKILLYSKFGLEDQRTIKVQITNKHFRKL